MGSAAAAQKASEMVFGRRAITLDKLESQLIPGLAPQDRAIPDLGPGEVDPDQAFEVARLGRERVSRASVDKEVLESDCRSGDL